MDIGLSTRPQLDSFQRRLHVQTPRPGVCPLAFLRSPSFTPPSVSCVYTWKEGIRHWLFRTLELLRLASEKSLSACPLTRGSRTVDRRRLRQETKVRVLTQEALCPLGEGLERLPSTLVRVSWSVY